VHLIILKTLGIVSVEQVQEPHGFKYRAWLLTKAAKTEFLSLSVRCLEYFEQDGETRCVDGGQFSKVDGQVATACSVYATQ